MSTPFEALYPDSSAEPADPFAVADHYTRRVAAAAHEAVEHRAGSVLVDQARLDYGLDPDWKTVVDAVAAERRGIWDGAINQLYGHLPLIIDGDDLRSDDARQYPEILPWGDDAVMAWQFSTTLGLANEQTELLTTLHTSVSLHRLSDEMRTAHELVAGRCKPKKAPASLLGVTALAGDGRLTPSPLLVAALRDRLLPLCEMIGVSVVADAHGYAEQEVLVASDVEATGHKPEDSSFWRSNFMSDTELRQAYMVSDKRIAMWSGIRGRIGQRYKALQAASGLIVKSQPLHSMVGTWETSGEISLESQVASLRRLSSAIAVERTQ